MATPTAMATGCGGCPPTAWPACTLNWFKSPCMCTVTGTMTAAAEAEQEPEHQTTHGTAHATSARHR
jgi:hypothetical protein